MASAKGSNGRRSSKKYNRGVCNIQESTTTIEGTEDPRVSYPGDNVSGASKTTIPKGGAGTTPASSIDTEPGGNQENWCYPPGQLHSRNRIPVRSLPNDDYDHGNDTSKNMYTLQHTGCQGVPIAASSTYTDNGASQIEQCPHTETMHSDQSIGDRPMERNHELLGDPGNETTHLVGLTQFPIMQPMPRNFQGHSTESCLDTFGGGLSSEYEFNFDTQEMCGYPTPPILSSDCHTLPFKFRDDDQVNNNTPLQEQHQQQRAIKSEKGHTAKSEPEPVLTSTMKTVGKRSASGHESDDENSRSLKQSKISEDVDETNRRSLACPFYKNDSNKYHDCRQNVLRRIKDVKQHMFRKHRKPDFYCPVCFGIFSDAMLRDIHIQERQCTAEPDPVYDGISEEQKKTLSQYPSRGKTIETQWNDMWNVIFPNAPPPRSPYLGNYREEMIPLIRDLWNKKRDQIISSAFTNTSCINQHTPFIYSLMEKVFDLFEVESSQWTPPKGAVNPYEPKVETSPPQTDDGASDVYPNTQQLFTNFIPQLGMCSMFYGDIDETNEGTTPELFWADAQLDVMGSEDWGLDFPEQF